MRSVQLQFGSGTMREFAWIHRNKENLCRFGRSQGVSIHADFSPLTRQTKEYRRLLTSHKATAHLCFVANQVHNIKTTLTDSNKAVYWNYCSYLPCLSFQVLFALSLQSLLLSLDLVQLLLQPLQLFLFLAFALLVDLACRASALRAHTPTYFGLFLSGTRNLNGVRTSRTPAASCRLLVNSTFGIT